MLLDTTPCGLVDCHSHIVFGGNRARAFELRLTGPRYEEVACSGGGIDLTVTATRVVAQALGLDDVGTIETKHGRNEKREKRKTGETKNGRNEKRADLAIWNGVEPTKLADRIGFNPLQNVFSQGCYE